MLETLCILHYQLRISQRWQCDRCRQSAGKTESQAIV